MPHCDKDSRTVRAAPESSANSLQGKCQSSATFGGPWSGAGLPLPRCGCTRRRRHRTTPLSHRLLHRPGEVQDVLASHAGALAGDLEDLELERLETLEGHLAVAEGLAHVGEGLLEVRLLLRGHVLRELRQQAGLRLLEAPLEEGGGVGGDVVEAAEQGDGSHQEDDDAADDQRLAAASPALGSHRPGRRVERRGWRWRGLGFHSILRNCRSQTLMDAFVSSPGGTDKPGPPIAARTALYRPVPPYNDAHGVRTAADAPPLPLFPDRAPGPPPAALDLARAARSEEH